MTSGKSLIKKVLSGCLLAGGLFFYTSLKNSFPVQVQNLQTYSSISDKTNVEIKNQQAYENKDSNKKVSNELQKSRTKTYPTLIHKLIEFENEPLNGATICATLEENSLDTVIKRMEKHIPKKPASELSKKEAQNLFLKIDSAMYGQICRVEAECLQTAYMYYAVGDFYNLPISLVMTPPYSGEYHIFARWDAKRDGHDALNPDNPINEGDFNWDNESRSYFRRKFPLNDNDKYFIEEFFIPKETIEKGIYLKNMNEKEMWAFAHTTRAVLLAYQARDLHLGIEKELKIAEKIFGQVINTLDKAIELDSLCMPAYYYKTHYLGRWLMNPNLNFEEAIKSVNKALELNPKQPELWDIKGDIQRWPVSYPGYYSEMSQEQKDSLDGEAIKCYDKAIELLEEYRKIELSKKDRPIIGINYAKLSLLTDQEQSMLLGKWHAYEDLESFFQKEKNLEKRYEKLKQKSKTLEEERELDKEQEFYKEKVEENPKHYSYIFYLYNFGY